MATCKYQMNLPAFSNPNPVASTTGSVFATYGTDVCCGAYSVSKRPDGLHWAHYPLCVERNCPIIHPELLEGATLT